MKIGLTRAYQEEYRNVPTGSKELGASGCGARTSTGNRSPPGRGVTTDPSYIYSPE
jgi:hypothetical protein